MRGLYHNPWIKSNAQFFLQLHTQLLVCLLSPLIAFCVFSLASHLPFKFNFSTSSPRPLLHQLISSIIFIIKKNYTYIVTFESSLYIHDFWIIVSQRTWDNRFSLYPQLFCMKFIEKKRNCIQRSLNCP
jgi:hypothetical protein